MPRKFPKMKPARKVGFFLYFPMAGVKRELSPAPKRQAVTVEKALVVLAVCTEGAEESSVVVIPRDEEWFPDDFDVIWGRIHAIDGYKDPAWNSLVRLLYWITPNDIHAGCKISEQLLSLPLPERRAAILAMEKLPHPCVLRTVLGTVRTDDTPRVIRYVYVGDMDESGPDHIE